MSLLKQTYNNWKEYISKNKRIVASTVLLAILSVVGFGEFVKNVIEVREGFTFEDPFLSMFPVIDLSAAIAVIFYSALVYTAYFLILNPSKTIIAMQAYILMLAVRVVLMSFLPLGPPIEIIPLQDPVFAFSTSVPPTKDLFFSGHTATMFLCFLLLKENMFSRVLMAIVTVTIGLMMLLHKVHYTVDVLAAPFFAYGCYRMILTQVVVKHED